MDGIVWAKRTPYVPLLGIEFVLLSEQVDTSTPTGRLLFHVLGSIAEFERDLIRDRVVAGMRAAGRRGAHLGRPKGLGECEVKRAARLRRQGHSLRAIASQLGVSKSTVSRALTRDATPAQPV